DSAAVALAPATPRSLQLLSAEFVRTEVFLAGWAVRRRSEARYSGSGRPRRFGRGCHLTPAPTHRDARGTAVLGIRTARESFCNEKIRCLRITNNLALWQK